VVLDAHAFSGNERVADIGSGGGLPGIPLKLALPGIRLTLVESDQRKAEILHEVTAELDLAGVEVLARRAEEVGREVLHRDGYDVVLTRAAARAPVAAEYCLPLVRPGGVLLALARWRDWEPAAHAVGRLGGRLRDQKSGVVRVDKVGPTPDAYPRRVGTPGKRPLA
jgi:16S rRNA (guanine527-N7)-methyltransferase